MRVTLEFKLEDCWIGVFWRRRRTWEECMGGGSMDIWLCLLPCFPIHIVL